MNEQIVSIISEYIHSYEDLKNTIADESRLDKLTEIYYELIDIAENNSADYEKFSEVCLKKDILKCFRAELDRIKEED